MLRKTLCLLLCGLFIVLCFTGCGEPKGSDAALVFPIDNDPEYLDPQIISDPGAVNIISNCFEGLVALNDKGEIVPGTAESWDVSDNGLTYTFRIRQNALWRVSIYAGPLISMSSTETNKLPVTAYDFDFGITRALLPETKSPCAKALYCIKNAAEVNSGKSSSESLGVEALDDYTLRITLERKDPDFLYTLLEPGCMPCNEGFFEATGGRYGLAVKYLIYNGPFYINNWVDNSNISVKKNVFYHDSDNVTPRSIYFSINDEQDTRLSKLKDKTYSVSPLTTGQAEEISDHKKYTLAGYNNSVFSLVFNCSDSILSNKNIRCALAAGLDYEILQQDLGQLTATGIIPGSLALGEKRYSDFSQGVSPYSHNNPAELFAKGLKALQLDKCEITILCPPEAEATVRKLMQQWQASLGISLAIFVETAEESEILSRVSSHDYQMAFVNVSFSGNTAFNALEKFTSSSKDNILALKDKKYDAAVNSIKLADGLSETAKKAKQAEEYLMSLAAVIPLYSRVNYFGLAKGVSGTYFNKTGDVAYFKYTLSE